jgi:secreted trypsin-like serine protease
MATRRSRLADGRDPGCRQLILPSVRLMSAVAAVATMLALLLACSSQRALAAPVRGVAFDGNSVSLVPYIIGGHESQISQFPWQVYVVGRHPEGGGEVDVTSCGGSILNATTILTAAHCVDHDGIRS